MNEQTVCVCPGRASRCEVVTEILRWFGEFELLALGLTEIAEVDHLPLCSGSPADQRCIGLSPLAHDAPHNGSLCWVINV